MTGSRALGARWRDPLDEFSRPIALMCDRGLEFRSKRHVRR
jgi:hypothetical protein